MDVQVEERHFMDRRSPSPRIVTVSRDGLLSPDELGRLRSAGADCEQVASPYEAAAALLAEPAAAVAVDLPLIARKHLRMLDLARKLGVTVLATGPVPMGLTSDDLRGVRLLARGELADVLARLVEGRPDAELPEPPAGRYEPERRSQTYEQQGRATASVGPAAEGGTEPSEPPKGEQERGREQPRSQSDILTSDEIAALLEEDL
jgi:hypothetical protein